MHQGGDDTGHQDKPLVSRSVDDPSDGGALRRLELIEALALGIDGKRALWAALQAASERMPDLRSVDYPRLLARADLQRGLARADLQRGTVERRRLQAALEALADATLSETHAD